MKTGKQIPSLPAVIATYLAEANAGHAGPAAACFATEAEVRDEGRTHRGPEEIRAWIDVAARKYRPQVEPLRAVEADGRLTVTARVSGDFPGSPAELDFVFTLSDGRIARLEIS